MIPVPPTHLLEPTAVTSTAPVGDPTVDTLLSPQRDPVDNNSPDTPHHQRPARGCHSSNSSMSSSNSSTEDSLRSPFLLVLADWCGLRTIMLRWSLLLLVTQRALSAVLNSPRGRGSPVVVHYVVVFLIYIISRWRQ